MVCYEALHSCPAAQTEQKGLGKGIARNTKDPPKTIFREGLRSTTQNLTEKIKTTNTVFIKKPAKRTHPKESARGRDSAEGEEDIDEAVKQLNKETSTVLDLLDSVGAREMAIRSGLDILNNIFSPIVPEHLTEDLKGNTASGMVSINRSSITNAKTAIANMTKATNQLLNDKTKLTSILEATFAKPIGQSQQQKSQSLSKTEELVRSKNIHSHDFIQREGSKTGSHRSSDKGLTTLDSVAGGPSERRQENSDSSQEQSVCNPSQTDKGENVKNRQENSDSSQEQPVCHPSQTEEVGNVVKSVTKGAQHQSSNEHAMAAGEEPTAKSDEGGNASESVTKGAQHQCSNEHAMAAGDEPAAKSDEGENASESVTKGAQHQSSTEHAMAAEGEPAAKSDKGENVTSESVTKGAQHQSSNDHAMAAGDEPAAKSDEGENASESVTKAAQHQSRYEHAVAAGGEPTPKSDDNEWPGHTDYSCYLPSPSESSSSAHSSVSKVESSGSQSNEQSDHEDDSIRDVRKDIDIPPKKTSLPDRASAIKISSDDDSDFCFESSGPDANEHLGQRSLSQGTRKTKKDPASKRKIVPFDEVSSSLDESTSSNSSEILAEKKGTVSE